MTVKLNRTFPVAVIASSFILGGASSALAQQARQDTGFYVGGAVGEAKAKDACTGLGGVGFVGGCDDKDTAWKLFGGYQFNHYLGAELGYVDLGKFSASGTVLGAPATASAEAKGVELVGVVSYPFTPQFSVYGKAGAFRWDVDTRATAGAAAASVGDHGTDFTLGAGVKYDFTRNLGARLEFQRYNNVGENNTTGQTDINLWTIGLVYKFR